MYGIHKYNIIIWYDDGTAKNSNMALLTQISSGNENITIYCVIVSSLNYYRDMY